MLPKWSVIVGFWGGRIRRKGSARWHYISWQGSKSTCFRHKYKWSPKITEAQIQMEYSLVHLVVAKLEELRVKPFTRRKKTQQQSMHRTNFMDFSSFGIWRLWFHNCRKALSGLCFCLVFFWNIYFTTMFRWYIFGNQFLQLLFEKMAIQCTGCIFEFVEQVYHGCT